MFKILFVLAVLLMSCTSTKPLDERGCSKQKRIEFIKDKEYPDHFKKAFIEREVKLGFDKILVKKLFGKPNMDVGDSIWYYSSKLSTFLRVEFNSLGKVESLSY